MPRDLQWLDADLACHDEVRAFLDAAACLAVLNLAADYFRQLTAIRREFGSTDQQVAGYARLTASA
jgi:hypothetical protein